MAQINVSNLTFAYEGSFDNIFENVSFNIDTDWKLGFIGRNGKGKTTFLKILLGNLEYEGTISKNTVFDYFPYELDEDDLDRTADELTDKWKAGVENWRVLLELNELKADSEIMYRPIKTLSFGERTKVMLAVLFSGNNEFLMIDEPTNHLDIHARECVKEYLAKKKGFILVSHDRDLLDAVTNHILVLNRDSIDVQSGNFSSWWDNKEKADAFARSENEKHLKEIRRLKETADRSSRWADKNENTKIGFDPIKEPERNISTRSYIGAKTKKMQSRVKNYEKRMERSIEEKEGLLNDIEDVKDLKLMPLEYYKERIIDCRDFSIRYKDAPEDVFDKLTFECCRGDRVFLRGENGCGKSTLIKTILAMAAGENGKAFLDDIVMSGIINVGATLKISYINQDTSHLKGNLKEYATANNLDYTLLLSLLNHLDFARVQYSKNMEDYSEGQKKKVLIASSLLTKAHLYIWDEPLNYIDVFSRMQIEKLIEKYKPTMIIVEHDVRFAEKIATKVVDMV